MGSVWLGWMGQGIPIGSSRSMAWSLGFFFDNCVGFANIGPDGAVCFEVDREFEVLGFGLRRTKWSSVGYGDGVTPLIDSAEHLMR